MLNSCDFSQLLSEEWSIKSSPSPSTFKQYGRRTKPFRSHWLLLCHRKLMRMVAGGGSMEAKKTGITLENTRNAVDYAKQSAVYARR